MLSWPQWKARTGGHTPGAPSSLTLYLLFLPTTELWSCACLSPPRVQAWLQWLRCPQAWGLGGLQRARWPWDPSLSSHG